MDHNFQKTGVYFNESFKRNANNCGKCKSIKNVVEVFIRSARKHELVAPHFGMRLPVHKVSLFV